MTTTETIDRYLNGELSAAEQAKFEKELGNNEALRKQLEVTRMIKDAIHTSALRAQVRDVHQAFMKDYQREQVADSQVQEAKVVPLHRPKNIFWWGSRVAAAVVLLVVSVVGFQYGTVEGEGLYEEKFIPYKLPTVRSSNTPEQQLDVLYAQGNFGEIIKQTAKNTKKQPHDLFLLAMSQLHQKQFADASQTFQQLRQANAQRGVKYFEAETDYYEALALLGNKQYSQARQQLERIQQDPKHLFHANVSGQDLWKLRLLGWKK
jgi:hypothetical protein